MRRLAPLAGLLLLSLVVGCDHLTTAQQRSARKEVDSFVAFVRPVTDGYAVANSAGKVQQTVKVGRHNWVAALTPDLTGYELVKFPKGQSRLEVVLKLGSWSDEQTVLEHPWDTGDRPPKLAWASAAGDSLFLNVAGVVAHWFACGSRLQHSVLADDVGPFTFSMERLYYIQRSTPRLLRSRRWQTADEAHVDLPSEYDYLWTASDGDHVIACKQSLQKAARKDEFVLIEWPTGRVTHLTLPVQAEVLDIVPLKGTSKAVVELWSGGRERADGTELTAFALWDYSQNKVTELFTNWEMYQAHVRNGNIQSVAHDCGVR